MQLYDPTVQAPQRNTTRADKLQSLEGLTIGLLSNQKLNADLFLREVGNLFANRHGCQLMEMAFKDNASAPANGKTIEQLSQSCDFLITAIGD